MALLPQMGLLRGRNTTSDQHQILIALRSRKPSLNLSSQYLNNIPSLLFIPDICSFITRLDISYNNLLEIPCEISRLSKLAFLSAQNNLLLTLPDNIGDLQQLRTIDVSRNHLSAIPESFSQLRNLERANFSGNRIKAVERSVFLLPELSSFHILNNSIENIPQDVYLAGLQAIRKFFEIEVQVHATSRDEISVSFLDELRQLTLHTNEDTKVVKQTQEEDKMVQFNDNISSHPNFRADYHNQCLPTSDYGSLSAYLDTMTTSNQDSFSCSGDHGSESDYCLDDTDECESYLQFLLSDSDSESEEEYKDQLLPNRTRLLRYKGVAVIIPEHNKNGYRTNQFSLNVIEDISRAPETSSQTARASQVISLEPHGAQFYQDKPALLQIPLFASVGEHDIVCLCSDTNEFEQPLWEALPRESYTVQDNCVMIKTWHFSLFTVLLRKPCPEAAKEIKASVGGFVKVEEEPCVEVNFPAGSLYHDIDASVKVLYDYPTFEKDPVQSPPRALATPVIELGPHGCEFNQLAEPVTVRLPLPHYKEICQRFGAVNITIWHSGTTEYEPIEPEQLDIEYSIDVDENDNYSICFPVTNFCFLWGLMDVVGSKLNEARLGVAHLFSDTQFQMKCQALMIENSDTHTFGLSIITYRSDKKLPEIGNYQHWVGRSSVAKLIKQGDIVVRLVSECFEADTNAGEDETLAQFEKGFNGCEFEKQFACKFKNKPIDRGVFGKVIVEKMNPDGSREDLFKFNLIKNGDEGEISGSTNPWMMEPVKELAGFLNITDAENWKIFARELGFTRHEISNKLTMCTDPLTQILNLYMRRGGTPEEFVQAMYDVNRKVRMGDTTAEGDLEDKRSRWRSLFNFNSTPSREINTFETPRAEMSSLSKKRSCTSGENTNTVRKCASPRLLTAA
uniref:Uncharacterized protein LOC100373718 n=1 Tax=Saccoglossus kowalevskii TaxID=10224 RepID=A0ABM0MCF0_SACKO|nr:PREDICTED: uncharacterized protein LOC100373718 [Saccoglossus kowalevskii]